MLYVCVFYAHVSVALCVCVFHAHVSVALYVCADTILPSWYVYSVHTVFLAEKSPYIRSYTM